MTLGRGDHGWKQVVRAVAPQAEFAPPATAAQLDSVEATLGHPLPPVLRELLAQTNGVVGEHGLGLVWDVERIERENTYFRYTAEFRDLYMPFTPLLFFADAGNGDQFAFVRQPLRDDDIYAWDHENDSRTWVAPSLAVFLAWWADGRLKL